MKEEKYEYERVNEVKLTTELRKSGAGDFVNLYVVLDGRKFELVPHCRTKRETAYFYNLLARSPLSLK